MYILFALLMAIIGGISVYAALSLGPFYSEPFCVIAILALAIAAALFIKAFTGKKFPTLLWLGLGSVALLVISSFAVLAANYTRDGGEMPIAYISILSDTWSNIKIRDVTPTTATVNTAIGIDNKRSSEIILERISCKVYYREEGEDWHYMGYGEKIERMGIKAKERVSVEIPLQVEADAINTIWEHFVLKGENDLSYRIEGSAWFRENSDSYEIPLNVPDTLDYSTSDSGEKEYWEGVRAQVPENMKRPIVKVFIERVKILNLGTAVADGVSIYIENPTSSEVTLEKIGCHFYYCESDVDRDIRGEAPSWQYMGYGEKVLGIKVQGKTGADPGRTMTDETSIDISLDKLGGEALMAVYKHYTERGIQLSLDIFIKGSAWFSDMEPIPFRVETTVFIYGPEG